MPPGKDVNKNVRVDYNITSHGKWNQLCPVPGGEGETRHKACPSL